MHFWWYMDLQHFSSMNLLPDLTSDSQQGQFKSLGPTTVSWVESDVWSYFSAFWTTSLFPKFAISSMLSRYLTLAISAAVKPFLPYSSSLILANIFGSVSSSSESPFRAFWNDWLSIFYCCIFLNLSFFSFSSFSFFILISTFSGIFSPSLQYGHFLLPLRNLNRVLSLISSSILCYFWVILTPIF